MPAIDLKPIMQLLTTRELAEMGPGPRPGVETQLALEGKLSAIFLKSKISEESRRLSLALVLLWHDHLDAAHVIAQEIDNSDGAFIHGIVHRREPDYGNAKYWFRRVGNHGAFGRIAERVVTLFATAPSKSLCNQIMPDGEWDPGRFVDACEQAARKGKSHPDYELLQQAQRLETEALLEHLQG
jgi:hypothetical protein